MSQNPEHEKPFAENQNELDLGEMNKIEQSDPAPSISDDLQSLAQTTEEASLNDAFASSPPPDMATMASLPPNSPPTDNSSSSPAKNQKNYFKKSWVLLLIAILFVSAWQWWEMRKTIQEIRVTLADRLAESEKVITESQAQQQQAKEMLSLISSRLQDLENQANEAKGQQQALQQLYLEINRSRDDNTLLEVERALIAASQHLQLSNNIPSALVALQATETRLAQVNRPAWAPLRQAVNRDINRLKTLPFIDTKNINQRLERIIAISERIPLKASLLSAHDRTSLTPTPPQTQSSEEPSFWSRWGERFLTEFWLEVKGLVRIERFNKGDSPLLAPDQGYYLRENLRLRLLEARLALFNQDYDTYRNDLLTARGWLEHYFDEQNPDVVESKKQLLELAEAQLKFEMPTLNESFSALKNAEVINVPATIDNIMGKATPNQSQRGQP